MYKHTHKAVVESSMIAAAFPRRCQEALCHCTSFPATILWAVEQPFISTLEFQKRTQTNKKTNGLKSDNPKLRKQAISHIMIFVLQQNIDG